MTVARGSKRLCFQQHLVFDQNEQNSVWRNTKLGNESIRKGQSVHRKELLQRQTCVFPRECQADKSCAVWSLTSKLKLEGGNNNLWNTQIRIQLSSPVWSLNWYLSSKYKWQRHLQRGMAVNTECNRHLRDGCKTVSLKADAIKIAIFDAEIAFFVCLLCFWKHCLRAVSQ